MSYKAHVKAQNQQVEEYLERILNPKKKKKRQRNAFNQTVERRIKKKTFNPSSREQKDAKVLEEMRIVVRDEYRERYGREPTKTEMELGLRELLETIG